MNTHQLGQIAMHLDVAASSARPIPQITKDLPSLSVEDAYRIQSLSIEERVKRGERKIGVKMGLTSRAKMRQVGVSEPVSGWLTDQMVVEEGGTFFRGSCIHPRIEPEIAFLIGKRLSGPVTPLQAMAAIEAVTCAMEIIDSRFQNFRFTLPDVIADNASACRFVAGTWRPNIFDVSNLGMVMSINGAAAAIGSSAAILGDPVRSLVMAARMICKQGGALEPGDVILAGGATAAIELTEKSVLTLEVQDLGEATVYMDT